MLSPIRRWVKSRAGGLDEGDLDSVRWIIEHHGAAYGPHWKQRAVRTVLAVVVEYPESLNPPPRGADLAIHPRHIPPRDKEDVEELKGFVHKSPWAKWADENWETIDQWLTANIDNLQVREEGDRFVLSN